MTDERDEELNDEDDLTPAEKRARAPYGINPNNWRVYTTPVEARKITARQRQFAEHYVNCFNAAEAARRTGYSPTLVASAAVKILQNPVIQREIKRLIEERVMSVDEIQVRLASQARAEYGEYFLEDGTVDLSRLLADGKGYLIKNIKRTKDGIEITWHDAQTALGMLAKVAGLYTETVNNTGKVTIQVNYGKKPLRPDAGEDLQDLEE